MKIEGSYLLTASRDTAWRSLLNPEVLQRLLPGCEKLEPLADGSYKIDMKIGVGAVKGTYQGRFEILDAVAPESYRLKVEGKGAGGFMKGEGTLRLSEGPGGETRIDYAGDAQV